MSTETFTQKSLLNAGLSGPQNYYYYYSEPQQHHHLYHPAPRLSALASPHLSATRAQAKQAKFSSRRSTTSSSMTRQQRRASQQLQPQPLHPLTTLVAVVFDFFLRGILDLTWPLRELCRMFVRGVFASLCWAYHALPLPLAMGLLYFGFQSVPDAFRSVEELRAVYSSRQFSVMGSSSSDASGMDGLYALGELALVRWGDLGVSSAFYCLAMMTAAYAVMLLIEMRDYVRDTWALIRDEALEVKALRADE
ncbi:hypothetical protein GCG54_00006997 [Colletotrichum gloeosporioides]|uniref:Uncharacterized protein n=2 Tax=Colletotrichum gloeosporioides TaxID=474922 RepID=A0A8H4CBI4_COLGL|nr:uncharacterized protein GCG54_00006997 [Colletotrichum gloeosporioides]KAF3800738.1 hypothetical protein GCG54_00006997 [Colletotrichum gloeosporioides]